MTAALLLHDEGPTAGLGHRTRMTALADALRRHGVGASRTAIGPSGLPEGPAVDVDVVVVDSYEHRADAVVSGALVVAVDDLDRDLAVDLVVIPAGDAAEEGTDRRARRARRELRGLRYALMSAPAPQTPQPGANHGEGTVLVSLGAADRSGLGAEIAERIADRYDGARVIHVPGPWSVPTSHPRVAVESDVTDLGPHLDAATVVVSAGGVTMLESLLRGRPTVVVPTAANQSTAVESVRAADAAVVLRGAFRAGDAADAVIDLLAEPARRTELGRRAAGLIDGRGADRVAEAVLELL